MAIFSKTITRIGQRLGAKPTGSHNDNLFFRTQSSQPTTFKIIVAGFLNKQMQPLQ